METQNEVNEHHSISSNIDTAEMSDESESKKRKQSQSRCCISHEFFRAAYNNPNKIAFVHASGGAQISKQLRSTITADFHGDIDNLLQEHAKSASPPVYQGDRCFTYSDVLTAVDSLTARLRSILLGADDLHLITPNPQGFSTHNVVAERSSEFNNMYTPKIVGIYMAPSVEYIVAVLSVLKCGEAFMPLDPLWPKERILSVIASSNAELIIASTSSFGRSSNSYRLDKSHWLIECSSCPVLCFSMEESRQECICPIDIVWPCEIGKDRLFCYLLYTSGSTGKPKGVCGTEQGLINRFVWMQELYPLQGEEILLFKTSISFVDHLQEFLGAILTACTLVHLHMVILNSSCEAYFTNRLTAVPSLMRAIELIIRFAGLVRAYYQRRVNRLLNCCGSTSLMRAILPALQILRVLEGHSKFIEIVSGDCMYFDCKRLPMILEMETVTSVPIGVPISNCNVVLVGENDTPNEGEIYVAGACVSSGYFSDSTFMLLDCAKLPQNSICSSSNGCGSQLYFKTGDFARRLQSGDLVFLGRKDRTVKVNGHRVALEEIEDVLRRHPDVVDVAVISSKSQGELVVLEAFIVLREERSSEIFRSSIRSWMVDRLPLAMLPNRFTITESIPVSSSGKVDYELLAGLSFLTKHIQDKIADVGSSDLLQIITTV
uniref:AMP-dependent synthetase/ligase domain-containing protein n=1 Tax=Fagus sylvatica TaxID=28930 RepID=A0A2N9EFS9_FAGSY